MIARSKLKGKPKKLERGQDTPKTKPPSSVLCFSRGGALGRYARLCGRVCACVGGAINRGETAYVRACVCARVCACVRVCAGGKIEGACYIRRED